MVNKRILHATLNSYIKSGEKGSDSKNHHLSEIFIKSAKLKRTLRKVSGPERNQIKSINKEMYSEIG